MAEKIDIAEFQNTFIFKTDWKMLLRMKVL